MYDAGDKRFTQMDPLQVSVSWYTYCENNPLIFIDPSGNVYNLVRGSVAHLTIQQYLENVYSDLSTNVYIKNGGRNGGKGFADVLKYNYPGSEIYEIKSITYQPDGYRHRVAVTQLSSYVRTINSDSDSGYRPATKGTSILGAINGVILPFPLDATKVIKIRTDSSDWGMIYYEIIQKKKEQRVEVVDFTPEREKTIGYYKTLACENQDSAFYPIDTYGDQEYWDAMDSWLAAAYPTVFSYHKHTYVKITYPDGTKMVYHVGFTSDYPTNSINPVYNVFDKYDIYFNSSSGWKNTAKEDWDASERHSIIQIGPEPSPSPSPVPVPMPLPLPLPI